MVCAIQAHEDWRAFLSLACCWAGGGCEFFHKGLPDRPGEVGVPGTKFGEAGEGDVGLDGDGEGVLFAEAQAVEEGVVGFCDIG